MATVMTLSLHMMTVLSLHAMMALSLHAMTKSPTLPDHALDIYNCTFGDGRDGSNHSDGYTDDRGDSDVCYDDTFITAAGRPATLYQML
ncbi:hypothetical protein GGH96_005364, partial [Coemansia sp. RSA 1972]